MRRPRAVAAFGSTLLFSSGLFGQVNVEPLREQVAAKGFAVRLRASATTYAGNTQGVIFGGSATLGARTQRHVAYVVLTGDYTRLDRVVSVAKWFAHARHNYQLSKRVWWEEYGQVESDRFRRVTLRELIGTGPRIGIVQGDVVQLFYGASYLYEHTALDTEDTMAVGEGGAHRFSNYLALTLRAHDRVSLSSVTYVQPRFDEPSDVNLLNVSSSDFTITELLHSRIDVTVRYDSSTPSDVEHADLELKSSLELVF